MKNKSYTFAEYGDLTKLNKTNGILYHVGKETLATIAKSYLDLLNTSSAIYERDGSYATALFSSSFCNFMDKHSRQLYENNDNVGALESGKWLCHESCWTHCSKVAIETGKPFDLKPCEGGINIYAVPIFVEGVIVGAINIGYGNPPLDEDKLQELSQKYNVDKNELKSAAEEYEKPPMYVVDAAKRNLHLAAELIAEIYTRKKREVALEEIRKELEGEVKRTYEQLLHSEKLTALGKLTGSIAHEINNPLFGIRNVIESVHDETINEETKNLLRLALTECDRIANLIFKLRDVYAPSAGNFENVDINLLIEDLALLYRRKLKQNNIELRLDLCTGKCSALMVPDQIKQVLMNLFQNAEDAIVQKRTAGLINVVTICSQEKITVQIIDNGDGIQEVRGSIPLSSTK